ncbi:hypothetical protein [Alkalinema sp. FACHB-956]|uniref:slr1601 family putative cell division protein n=1 Tax=Alkalinema sp. FACHB-956 TaxID=2692768 RepID=UPI00168908FE|nr:hypothetical protein [Alkalinema sp. FACHB-956]MBD2328319.1 hypothetical protein [Alkalinema sp. FACHB-956]
MSALHQLSQPSPRRSPDRARRPNPQARQRQQQRMYRLMAAETLIKLSVNVGISAVAITSLFQLLPYRSVQQAKLQEVQAELKSTETRVAQLQAQFSRTFDPNETKAILQEQTHLVDPTEKVVVFDDRADLEPQKTASNPE